MKFSVACNWDVNLPDGLKEYPEVEDVYAKLAVDVVGGGRPSHVLPQPSQEQVETYIKECHERGIEFTYLLNASCIGGLEFSKKWRYEFDRLLEWIVGVEADRVTVASPYIIQIIKRRYPNLKINVSCFALVNSVERAKWFEGFGVDEIAWDYMCIQRDFELMESMVRNVNCKFQLMVNNVCLYQCPYRSYHANLVSHASQSEHKVKEFIGEYCILNCANTKINNPVEMIKSPWVRPEDLYHYEEIGISKIKIIDRRSTTEWLLRAVKAYAQRRYDGNLFDILNVPGLTKGIQSLDGKGLEKLNPVKKVLFKAVKDLSADKIFYFDSKELNGFIDFFKKNNCRIKSCEKCGYCKRIADKAIKKKLDISNLKFSIVKTGIKRYLEGIYSGRILKKDRDEDPPAELTAKDVFGWLIPRIVNSGVDSNDVERIFNHVTDHKTWLMEWKRIANEYGEIGEKAEREGHNITAQEAYFMASRCNLWGQYVINKDSEEKKGMYYQAISWYLKSCKYFDPSIEKLEVPFEDTTLPAYLWKPSRIDRAPCVIILKIGDVTKEDYHWTAKTFVQRGLACFALDAPGSGESRLKGLLFEPGRFDKASSAAIDYLHTVSDIDSEKIGVWGNCLGGHFALRIAAFDSRIKACMVGSAHYNPIEVFDSMPNFWLEFMKYISGAKDKIDLQNKLGSKLLLDGIPSKIRCPLFLFYGAKDEIVPPLWAYKIYEEAKGPKYIKVFEGDGHGCHKVIPVALPMMGDWLKDKLYE